MEEYMMNFDDRDIKDYRNFDKPEELIRFFEDDQKIKKDMYNLSPVEYEQYIDEKSICDYSDKLNNFIESAFDRFKSIAKILDIDIDHISNLEETLKNNLNKCGLDIYNLKTFYKKYISSMDEGFINLVNEECVGYYECSVKPVLDKTISVNEILHFFHAYILNNEELLRSFPDLEKRTIDGNKTIAFRGVENPVFRDVYEKFSSDLDCGDVDMVSLDDKKMLIMIRDLGHAITTEISLNDDKARVEYFIPKLCNIDMINELPGVNKVKKGSLTTTGVYEIDIDNLSNSLNDFMAKIPGDQDMEFDDFKTY